MLFNTPYFYGRFCNFTVMEEIELNQKRGIDTVCIENKYKFPVYITISSETSTDLSVCLEFLNLNQDNFTILTNLTKENRPIKISSLIIEQKQFNISHILIRNVETDSEFKMNWDCLSYSGAVPVV